MTAPGESVAVLQTLRLRCAETPDQAALLAPGRLPLTRAGLAAHTGYLARVLAGAGLGAGDVVAAVLPDAEMLCAFAGACAVTGFAPLNPDLREVEFESYLSSLRPQALLVSEALRSPAVQAARALRIPVYKTHSTPDRGAGLFTLPDLSAEGEPPAAAAPAAVALLLHTSATTGRAKCVCITHANLAAMARVTAQSMLLSRADRFLNMMPVYHLQGLLSSVAQWMAGGSVICATPFDASRFPEWVDEFQPTWYTAGPALHRTILALLREAPEVAGRLRLRFVRSIGSALPPALLGELEAALHIPVVEGYGLTEAGAVTSTPLAPYKRKAGSAGTRVVPGVEIMDQAGNLLPAGHAGEIVLCGPNVMQEYRNDPEATRSAFRNGWFRTGDLGRFDDEGYLFVIGRIKEIINRGGEKILPVEIDQALMTHPEVADAAAFAAPHPQLGEDVAAAVVLRPGAVFDEAAIRAFLAPRLAAFKIPRVWMPVSSIPRGASGKVQRSRLVEQYAGLQEARSAGRAAAGPRSEVESKLAEIWETVLGVPVRDVESDFFELGGHSLAAGRVLARIEQTFGVQLGYDALLAAPTIRRQAALLGQPDQRQITAIQPDGSKPPFFMVRPLPVFRPLATRLGKERPFLGLVMPSGEQLAGGADWAGVARQLVSVLRRRQPSGPYHLGGWCADGVLAFEMAQQLTAQGESVALLALFDTPSPAIVRGCPARVALRRRLDMLCWEARFHLASVRQLGRREVPGYLGDRMAAAARRLAAALRALVRPAPPAGDVRAGRHHPSGIRLRISAYDGRPYMGSLTLFRAEGRRWAGSENDPGYGWARWAQGGLTVHPVPGNHLTMFLEPNVQVLARKLSAELARADAAVAMRAGPVIIR